MKAERTQVWDHWLDRQGSMQNPAKECWTLPSYQESRKRYLGRLSLQSRRIRPYSAPVYDFWVPEQETNVVFCVNQSMCDVFLPGVSHTNFSCYHGIPYIHLYFSTDYPQALFFEAFQYCLKQTNWMLNDMPVSLLLGWRGSHDLRVGVYLRGRQSWCTCAAPLCPLVWHAHHVVLQSL